MIDTDKYEPTQMDWILHNTREHSPDGWRKLSKSLIELSDDNRLLIEYAPLLLAEVKRLRDELKFVVEMLEGKPSNMEWYECRNLILEQVVMKNERPPR